MGESDVHLCPCRYLKDEMPTYFLSRHVHCPFSKLILK